MSKRRLTRYLGIGYFKTMAIAISLYVLITLSPASTLMLYAQQLNMVLSRESIHHIYEFVNLILHAGFSRSRLELVSNKNAESALNGNHPLSAKGGLQ